MRTPATVSAGAAYASIGDGETESETPSTQRAERHLLGQTPRRNMGRVALSRYSPTASGCAPSRFIKPAHLLFPRCLLKHPPSSLIRYAHLVCLLQCAPSLCIGSAHLHCSRLPHLPSLLTCSVRSVLPQHAHFLSTSPCRLRTPALFALSLYQV